jgi:hypothetical protein
LVWISVEFRKNSENYRYMASGDKSKSFLRPFRPFFERSIYAKLLEAEQFW